MEGYRTWEGIWETHKKEKRQALIAVTKSPKNTTCTSTANYSKFSRRETFYAKADQICYAVLCVFSFVATAGRASSAPSSSNQQQPQKPSEPSSGESAVTIMSATNNLVASYSPSSSSTHQQ
ncbi:unnamed protein product [Anisakis simplex]|uniref:Ovule protein n=1 Tax=Anisakis simplex TaxID=6269 RepID=A0A0M3JXM8_ANISI|nr:unnamed protein product [Anisakis simplex]